MAMPDAIEALLQLTSAPRAGLTRTAYNVSAFSPTADEIRDVALRAFPSARITLPRRPPAPGHRRFVAGRGRRRGGEAGLGIRAEVRFRAGLRRLPDSDHPRALPPAVGRTCTAAPPAPTVRWRRCAGRVLRLAAGPAVHNGAVAPERIVRIPSRTVVGTRLHAKVLCRAED